MSPCVTVTKPAVTPLRGAAVPRFHLLRGQGSPGGAVTLRVTCVFPKEQAAAAVLPKEDEAARPGSLFRQLLTDDEDAAAPSLFKLGWLSGMTK